MAKTNKSNSSAPKVTTLADLFDGTDASEATNMLPEGEHELRLSEFTMKADPKKGTAAFAKFDCIDGDNEGKGIKQMYKLTDADGNKGQGMAYLKRDLELLGYKDVPGKKLEKVLKEISEEQPMVLVTVKQNGKYMNAFLGGLAGDGDVSNTSDDSGDEAEIEVGSKVKFEDENGDEQTGEVTKIKGDTLHVDVDGDIVKVEKDDAELVTDDESGSGSDEIEVGSKVKGENEDGDDIEGEVVKIKGDTVTVKDEDGEKHKCDLGDLELVTDDESGGDETTEAPEEGDTVSFIDPDDEDEILEGEVVKVNEKKETFDAKVGKKTYKGIDFDQIRKDEVESTSGNDEPYAPEEGDEVKFTDSDGDEQEGTVVSVNTKKEIAEVKVGKEKHKVAFDDMEKVDDEDTSGGGDTESFEEGDEVKFEDSDGDEQEGVILSINEKKKTAKVKVGKEKFDVDLDDLEKND